MSTSSYQNGCFKTGNRQYLVKEGGSFTPTCLTSFDMAHIYLRTHAALARLETLNSGEIKVFLIPLVNLSGLTRRC